MENKQASCRVFVANNGSQVLVQIGIIFDDRKSTKEIQLTVGDYEPQPITMQRTYKCVMNSLPNSCEMFQPLQILAYLRKACYRGGGYGECFDTYLDITNEEDFVNDMIMWKLS